MVDDTFQFSQGTCILVYQNMFFFSYFLQKLRRIASWYLGV